VTSVVSGIIGERMGATNTGVGIGTLVLITVFLGVPVLVYLLDAQLARRVPRLQESRLFVGLVSMLRRIADLAYPRKLVLPVQLTLQTNTRPLLFYVALTLGVTAIIAIGNARLAAWQSFTLSGQFTYLDDAAVRGGFRSMLDEICGSADEAPDTVNCLRRLWSVSIEGTEVPMDGFVRAERADLGMRGLIGVVPLTGLQPGMHRIEIIWNPEAGDQDVPLDDRYAQATNTYVIPIAFAPGYELPTPR
jgi:hypothetical protein